MLMLLLLVVVGAASQKDRNCLQELAGLLRIEWEFLRKANVILPKYKVQSSLCMINQPTTTTTTVGIRHSVEWMNGPLKMRHNKSTTRDNARNDNR